MKDVTVTCDACGADLTWTGNCVGYRLLVTSEPILSGPDSGPVTAVMIYPPVSRPHHFCDVRCLQRSTLVAPSRSTRKDTPQ